MARDAIRGGLARERNRDTRGAFLIALGIAADPRAESGLKYELAHSGDARTRSLAAVALALAMDDAARLDLRRALADERSPEGRIAMAQALAHLGESSGPDRGEDADLLYAVLADTGNPQLQAGIAAALAAQGSLAGLDHLAAALEGDDVGATPRAAALQAVGALLDEEPPFALAALSQHANFAAFPDWIHGPLTSSL